MRVPMGTYVTYEELNDGEACSLDGFRRLLSRYQRSKVLYLCGLINCLTRKWHGAFDKTAHDELASVAFKPALLEYLAAHPDNPRRIVFHRLQALFIAKEAAIFCSEDGVDPLNTPHWGGMGEVFVMANDLIHTRIGEGNQPLRRLTQYLSATEYSSPYDLRAILARCNLTLTRFMPPITELNIPDLFEKASGLALNDFRIMCLGILVQYFDLDGEAYKKDKSVFLIGPDFFRSTTVPQEKVDLFLKELSFEPQELKTMFETRNGGRLDFTPFRHRPLVRLDRAYFPIDTKFLAEKLEAGVFWRIHSSVEDKCKSSLHSAWGKGFESYTNWLLKHSTDGTINALYESPTFQESEDQVTDAMIVCGNKAIFIECKTAMMRVEAKYGGNSAVLAAELHKKFVQSKERPQGLKQLAVAINSAFNKKHPRPINGVDLSKILTVYPVILTRDSIGGSLGLSKYLRNFFKAEIKQKSLNVVVTPLFCLSIDQLEEISDVLGNTSLGELLYGWWRRDRTLGLNFLMASDTDVRTQTRTLNTALLDALDELFDETMKYFPDCKSANRAEIDAP